MRIVLNKKFGFKIVATLMLTFFIVWSFLYSLHFLFRKKHSSFSPCHECSSNTSSQCNFSHQTKASYFSQEITYDGQSCLFCLFAEELSCSNISIVFSLNSQAITTFVKDFNYLTHFSQTPTKYSSRAPPVKIG
jgi:hypothetical protein